MALTELLPVTSAPLKRNVTAVKPLSEEDKDRRVAPDITYIRTASYLNSATPGAINPAYRYSAQRCTCDLRGRIPFHMSTRRRFRMLVPGVSARAEALSAG